MRLIPKQLNEAGDTLVEVLIAVAIISSVLMGAFVVSQKSTIAVLTSQEQSEMLQILQGQVELVRALAIDQMSDTTGVFSSTNYFCIDTRPGATQNQRVNSMTVLPALEMDDFTGYDDACKNYQGRYNVAIRYNPAPTSKTFTFYGRWDGLGGNKKQEQLTYRVYPGIAASTSSSSGAGADGSAAVDGVGCKIDPLTQKCEISATASRYQWTATVVNNSYNPGLTIQSCSWDWGDGTDPNADDNRSCNYGDKLTHQYPVTPGLPLLYDPAFCRAIDYTLTFTITFTTNAPKTDKLVRQMPACY